jgi:hypothetical protein
MLSDAGLNSATAENGLCEWRKCHAGCGMEYGRSVFTHHLRWVDHVKIPRYILHRFDLPCAGRSRGHQEASRGHTMMCSSGAECKYVLTYSTGNGVRSHAAGEPTCSLG